jgi:hypothetical protein
VGHGTLIRLAAAVLSVPLLLAACGSSAEDNGGTARASHGRELLARVSAAIAAHDGSQSLDDVVYADFVRAREQLVLPPDTDVYEQRSGKSPTPLLASVAARAMSYAGRPTVTPLQEAIDGGAIEASASIPVIGPPTALVVETSQPFEQISAALHTRGYARDGDLLVTARPTSRVFYPIVADAGDVVVVLAASQQAARAALGGQDAELTPAAKLIGRVPGVARAASTQRNRCIVARAAGQDLAPPEGEYLVVIDGSASAARLTVAGKALPGGQGDLIFGEAEAGRDGIRARFTSDDSANAVFSDVVDDDSLTSATEFELPYAC